ncbi:hypothetical protein [Mucilaginibacter ginsenosidivorans]|uniref:Anti-sigma factor n=1 Tax=Mucilaginibacter ginsenosidivorans TaxID=398053 RepID=A0A5B8UQC6_9SPHI|nr:hypothetical protein [Mucilaginibacter ginsenosidivorans]QEC61229.1 hypothetical protein FRZ54_01065 [Mucilaginibacter ginsenosidivorans]
MNLNLLKAKPLLMYAAIFLIVFAVSSCAQKLKFANSSVVPAAEGTVKIKKDNNNNYNIEIDVIRLADPKRLSPPKETYVVWIETENNMAKNIGQLKSSSGMFSSALTASISTVSPVKPTKIFITAEDSGDVQSPGEVILTMDSF